MGSERELSNLLIRARCARCRQRTPKRARAGLGEKKRRRPDRGARSVVPRAVCPHPPRIRAHRCFRTTPWPEAFPWAGPPSARPEPPPLPRALTRPHPPGRPPGCSPSPLARRRTLHSGLAWSSVRGISRLSGRWGGQVSALERGALTILRPGVRPRYTPNAAVSWAASCHDRTAGAGCRAN